MKPIFESVNCSDNNSFIVRKFKEKKFSAPYHFHPELELTFILKGNGTRYTGTGMNDYFSGDLVLLGPNVPHCWRTEEGSEDYSVSFVIHFNRDFLGEYFFSMPETADISQLLNHSEYGLQFTGENNEIKRSIICLFTEKNPFNRLISFLQILQKLSRDTPFIFLDKQNTDCKVSANEKQRISAVIAYIVENFQTSVSLKEAASIANMTTHAFCKYFKRMTRKTFLEALNDYRVGFATRQLINTDKSISDIAYESGFKDASNFHKTFKRKINLSPLVYRNTFMKKITV